MKGRLLLGLLVIATLVLWMYFKLTLSNPGLVSGFVVLATTIIIKVINSAEDILVALFKVGAVPVEDPAKKTGGPGSPSGGQADLRTVLGLCVVAIMACGCASYGLTHTKGHVNGVFTYNGVPVQGNVDIDNWTYLGMNKGPLVNIVEVENGTVNNTGPAVNTAK